MNGLLKTGALSLVAFAAIASYADGEQQRVDELERKIREMEQRIAEQSTRADEAAAKARERNAKADEFKRTAGKISGSAVRCRAYLPCRCREESLPTARSGNAGQRCPTK